MARSLATLTFIAAVASAALYLARRPTIASGRVMAADLLDSVKSRGITRMDCDPEIPIGITGAVFECKVNADDGSTARIQYTMNRAGGLAAQLIDSTGGSPGSTSRARVPPSDDPWGN